MGDSKQMTDDVARPGYEPFAVDLNTTWRNALDGRVQRKLPGPLYTAALTGYNGVRRLARKNPGRGRMLPDFVIIGAAKAGTTSLYAWLCEHPYVRPASAKEIHYFSFYANRGVDWYRKHFPLERERQAFASEHGRQFITGEASPSYLVHASAPARMAKLLPDAKLVVALRNPVDRAYSQFQMRRRDGEEPIEDFAEALGAEDPSFAAHAADRRGVAGVNRPAEVKNQRTYLVRGRYAEQLERWFEHYPREQFHVVATDDLAVEPHRVLDGVHEFLGLPPRRAERLKPFFTSSYASMSSEVGRRLVEYYRPHNQRLYQLLGKDFGWEA